MKTQPDERRGPLQTLRARLVFSHIVPLLVVLPLVGVALTYLLETQVLLAGLSRELEVQASLVAAMTRDYPQVWYDPQQAEALMARIAPRISAEVMFFDPQGVLLAASDPEIQALVGTRLAVPGLEEAVLSRAAVRVDYGEQPGTGAADVLMPVLTPRLQVVGVVRLTDPLSSVYQRFPRTRTFIVGALAGGMVVGALVGLLLALDLARPLRRATRALAQMADGRPLGSLPEQGPQEVRALLHAFNALSEQLRALEKARKRLLANLVHELGRPLGALLSATQALAGGAHEDAALRQSLLDGMQGQMRRMRRLLDDLTRLYDRSLGELALDCQPTPLAPWLRQMLSPWREAAQEKDVAWRVDIPEALPALTIDADRMAQALGNVVDNAIKYTPPGGAVTVTAGAEADAVWIRVRDTGAGIPPEERERIFEPFYRGVASRQRFPQGMGLGLSIARDLIDAHGGAITVDDAPEGGTLFAIRLPRPGEGDLSAEGPLRCASTP